MEERPHLYIIPIAHTYADMGSLRDKIPFDEQYEASVTRYWLGIFRYLNSLPPDFLAGLQIYQDGLVDAHREIVDKIVDETQTANYEILRWLKVKGATIFGTEDVSLLMEDYQALQTIANCPDGEVKTAARSEYLKKSGWILEERDKYIAQRIRETLPGGKTGLLFIGAAHDVGSLLSNEIRVSMPEIVNRVLPEVIEDYNGKGDLGIILQFAGIGLTEASFLRGRRYYGPDVTLFYSRINYQNKRALLILATEGDIFESQVVLAQEDINPFFQEELYLPQLTATHDPTSMTVFQNNNLVTVGYNPRTY